MSKEQLLQELAEAYEKLIRTATEAAQRGVTRQGGTWGPREILRKLDDTFFHPGEYVYERTKAVIEHCQEHKQALVLSHS